ncbi:MAG: hypothetical protein PVG07_14185, partial [Acidobacteriota bacterium]
MTRSPRPQLDALVPEAVPGVRILPVIHGRIESAAWVRAVLDALDPSGVAVELPTTFRDAARVAVRRLPRITLVVAPEPEPPPDDGGTTGGPGGDRAVVWTAAPGDPFAEALRWAAEREREWFLVDPDIPYAERHADPVPDPYALLELGPAAYLGPVLEALRRAPAGEADRVRERGMAYHLREARELLDRRWPGAGPLVVAVGAAHAARLAEDLRGPVAAPFARVRRDEGGRPEARHLHPESLTALLQDPPLAHAAWERLRAGDLPAPEEEPDPESGPDWESAASRPLSLTRAGLTLVHRGPRSGAGAGSGSGDPEERDRIRRLVDLAAGRGSRALAGFPARVPDRRALARVVWEVGARSYTRQTREETAPWQRQIFFDYLERLIRVAGGGSSALAGGVYEWVVAARGVGDDNLAWEVFDAARTFPWQDEAPGDLPTARIDGSDLLLPDEWGTRTVRFRRRHFRVKRRPVALPVRPRPRPADPTEWLAGFAGGGLCSYPPEDLVIEDYGRFLRARARGVLSAERARTEPFTTGMLDGIDLRETLRHPEDPRIRVRELGRAPGRADSVVVIFDRDLPAPDGSSNPRYPYLMTWLGEHHDESDMAFYSTHPAEQVVGPGIMRATYGGFLM